MIDFARMRELMQIIPRALWNVEQKNANATRITSVITGMPRGSGGENRSDDAKIMLIEAKDAYREALSELEAMRTTLAPLITELESEDERGIMRLRYIHGRSISEIAGIIFAHPRTVRRKLEDAEHKIVTKCH